MSEHTPEETPARAWGRLLAVYERLAELAGEDWWIQWTTVSVHGMTTTTVHAYLTRAVQHWVKIANRDMRKRAEVSELVTRAATLIEASASLRCRQAEHMTAAERMHVILGLHAERSSMLLQSHDRMITK